MYIDISVNIMVSPDTVWNAITHPEITRKYMFSDVVSSWKKGSYILWKGKNSDGNEIVFVRGIIQQIIPGKLLQYTLFDPNRGIPDLPHNYVVVRQELIQEAEGTRLQIHQGDYADMDQGEEIYQETLKGWQMTLPVLKELLEHSK